MRRFWILALSFLFLALMGCREKIMVMPHTEKKEEIEVAVVKMQDALFCFKCHTADKYNGKGGAFPHPKHKEEFGIRLHCNQCHDFKGHQAMNVIKKSNAPCSNCH